MSDTRRGIVLLVALSVIPWCSRACGQEGADASASRLAVGTPTDGEQAAGDPPLANADALLAAPAGTPAAPQLVDTGLETFYVRDASGKLVPVVNLPYEELIRLYELRRQLADPALPPTSVIKSLAMQGEVRDQLLRLEVTLEIETLAPGMIRTDLRFAGAVLDGPPRHEGPGEAVVDVLPDGGGYLCWLEGQGRDVHRLVLNFLVPTLRVGRETRVRLPLPAAAGSTLNLRVPERLATVTVQPATAVVSSRLTAEGATEWTASGLMGDVQLAWSEPAAEIPAPLLIEATGQLQVQIKGPASLTTEAKFRLTSFGREMQSIRIRLPRSCQPIAIEDAGYTTQFVRASELEWPATASKVEPDAQLAVIKFSQPTRGPIDVRLIVEQFPTHEPGTGPVEVMGFEVLGALRHSGTLQLFTEGDWLVRWDELADVRRVVPPPELAANDELVAAFEYDRQPASLPVLILTKETRIHVEPTYLFQVDTDRVMLTAWLAVRVLGAPTSSLYVDLAGFEVTNIGDANLIREDALRLSRVEPLEIPLASARRGEFRLEIRARRPIDPQAPTLRLPIPFVQNASAAPAVIVVDPADSITLKSVPQTLRLFDPETLPEEVARLASDRTPLCYRYRGNPTDGHLEYEMSPRERLVTVRPESLIRWSGDSVEVQQTVYFDVRHQPLERVRMRLPLELLQNPNLTMSLDGQTLPPDQWSPVREGDSDPPRRVTVPIRDPLSDGVPGSSELPDRGGAEGPAPDARREGEWAAGAATVEPDLTELTDTETSPGSVWDIPLGQPRLGEFVIQSRYRLTVAPPESAERPVVLSIPLVQPVTGECTTVAVRVETSEATVVNLGETSSWSATPTAAPRDRDPQVLELTSGSRPPSLPLVARRVEQRGTRPTIVDRAYAQTWFTESARQDRVTYRLSRVAWPLHVILPEDVMGEELQVLLNGALIEPKWEGALRLQLDAPLAAAGNVRLELLYPYVRRPRTGAMTLQLPELENAGWTRQLYWQFVTPGREHVVWGPSELHSEQTWLRRGLVWYRVPLRSQEWLEQWSGASRQLAPTGNSNNYLFSSFGPHVRLHVRTMPRALLLLTGAALVLAGVFSWRLLPASRRLAGLLLAAVVLAALAWVYPQAACLVAQAAALGLALWAAAQAIAACAGWAASPSTTRGARWPASAKGSKAAGSESGLRDVVSTQSNTASAALQESSASEI